MRTVFSKAIVQAAVSDSRIVLLTGDHGYALFDDFRRVCPAQYINAGVAEQNMVGVAAGLAKAGMRPIVYGLSAFVPMRVLEQIKLDVCYERLPVIFIGDGAGVVYGQLGSSHQSTEDIAALRALPEMSILSPADEREMHTAMQLALAGDRPVYVRMGKADLGAVHAEPPPFTWGQLWPVREGQADVAFIATGSMVRAALTVAEDYAGAPVWSAPCLKPLDTTAVVEICRRHQAVVVIEEHSIYGGLGSAVAEIAAAEAPTWVCRVGINDRFSEHCGSYAYLMREHGLDVDSIRWRVAAFLDQRMGSKQHGGAGGLRLVA